MDTVGLDRLSSALNKARNVGRVEQPFVMDGCEVTVSNLTAPEQAAVFESCQDLDDHQYIRALYSEHVARAIVELDGVDLRGVKFVEMPDPKDPEKSIKVERHAYILDNVLSTWSQDALGVAYQKAMDATKQGEERSRDGVTFLAPDETDEDKYRRLLLEAKECESELPDSLIDHILDEHGYMRKTTADEYKSAMERADQLAREQELEREQKEAAEAKPQAAEAPKPEPEPEPEVAPEPVAAPRAADPHQALQQAIAARTQMASAPTPEQAEPEASKPSRAERIAQLESTAFDSQGNKIEVFSLPSQEAVAEVRKQPARDESAVLEALETPPAPTGINPRFNPPKR